MMISVKMHNKRICLLSRQSQAGTRILKDELKLSFIAQWQINHSLLDYLIRLHQILNASKFAWETKFTLRLDVTTSSEN